MPGPKHAAANATVAVLAVLLLVASLLDWLGQQARVGPVEVSEMWSAWHFRFTATAVVLGALAGLSGLLRLCGLRVSNVVIIVFGALAFVLVLAKLTIGPHIDTGGFDVTIDPTREIGIYLGLVLTAGIAGVSTFELINEKRANTT